MKILLLELWGLGDATIMTAALGPLVRSGAKVAVLCKPGSIELLQPSYPQVEFIAFDAPWTAFRGKYRLASWPWRNIIQVLRACRRGKFDAAASVRHDPRDHLLMFLGGIPRRIGFPRKGSGLLLTRKLKVYSPKASRVDLWHQIVAAMAEIFARDEGTPTLHPALLREPSGPCLNGEAYVQREASRQVFRLADTAEGRRPVVGLHCGAKVAVRRWDERSFEQTIRHLREEARFHLALFPDSDDYGRGLLSLADSCHEGLTLPELVADLAACDLLICNDSGPGHIAAALGRPVLAIFGPGQPDWFRPYGARNHVVVRDICPFRPCFDSCHFSEPICLRQLTPEETWPEIRDWFLQQLALVDKAPRPAL